MGHEKLGGIVKRHMKHCIKNKTIK